MTNSTCVWRDLAKPLYFVSENLPGHVLLKSFLRRRTHLFGVMDDYGDLTGIVTLEDVLESLIGEEIVDEVDTVADMQEVARRRKREQFSSQESSAGRHIKSPPRGRDTRSHVRHDSDSAAPGDAKD